MAESGLVEFLQQIPAVIVIVFCGSALALLGVLAAIITNRSRRYRALQARVERAESARPVYGGADLPDVESLVTASPPRAARKGTYNIILTDGGETEVVEVLAVLRDVADGSLIVQVGEKAYRSPFAGADAEFRRRVQTTLENLLSAPQPPPAVASAPAAEPVVSAAPAQAEPAPSSEPPPQTESAAANPAEDDVDDLPLPDFEDAVIAPPAEATPPPSVTAPPLAMPPGVPLPGDLPRFKLPDNPEVPKRGRRPKLPTEPIPEINIADAIETFLQHKLMTTGAFSGRSIHIRSALGGGVAIEVDGKYYDTVGDVADAQVRAYLQQTIEEWQSRQG